MTAEEWTTASPGHLAGPTVWRIDLALDARRRDRCLTILCESERARADRFVRAEDRDRFLASHAALRVILAAALDSEPAALSFDMAPLGKPELGGAWQGRLRFNLSHSGDWALVGLSRTAAIGVDVEAVRALPDTLRIARNHFAPREVAVLSRVPAGDLSMAFFACWTRKEAVVKAIGLGLSMPLDRFTVSIPPQPAALVEIDGDAQAGRRWSLIHLDPAPGHIGAIAFEERDAVCALRSLGPGWLDVPA